MSKTPETISPETISQEQRRVSHAAMNINREGVSIVTDFFLYAKDATLSPEASAKVRANAASVTLAYKAWNESAVVLRQQAALVPTEPQAVRVASVECARNLCGLLGAIKESVPEDHSLHRKAGTLLNSVPADIRPVGMY